VQCQRVGAVGHLEGCRFALRASGVYNGGCRIWKAGAGDVLLGWTRALWALASALRAADDHKEVIIEANEYRLCDV